MPLKMDARVLWINYLRKLRVLSPQAKGIKSTSFLRNEVDLVPLACEDVDQYALLMSFLGYQAEGQNKWFLWLQIRFPTC